MEETAYSTLKQNISRSTSNNSNILNYDSSRSSRVRLITDNSITSSPDEWLQLMNAFIFVDYNINQQIDFNYYTITYDSHFREKTPLSVVYNQFIDENLNKTINFYESLKSFIFNLYKSPRSSEWINIKASNSNIQTLNTIVNYFIDHLLIPSFEYDVENNDPNILVSHIQSFIDTHFTTKIQKHFNLSLHSSTLTSLFPHTSIISIIRNHSTFNVSSSLHYFNQLFKSHFLTIPTIIYIESNGKATEKTFSLIIEPTSERITDLEQIFTPISITNNEYDTNFPQIITTSMSATFSQLSSLLISRFNNHYLLVSPHIHDNFLREMFILASNLFNTLHITESINILKYLSNYNIFDESPNVSSFNIYSPKIIGIQSRNKARIKCLTDSQPPLKPTTFDSLYTKSSKITTNYFLSFLLLFTLLSLIIYFITSTASQISRSPTTTSQEESFILMKHLYGGK